MASVGEEKECDWTLSWLLRHLPLVYLSYQMYTAETFLFSAHYFNNSVLLPLLKTYKINNKQLPRNAISFFILFFYPCMVQTWICLSLKSSKIWSWSQNILPTPTPLENTTDSTAPAPDSDSTTLIKVKLSSVYKWNK